MLDQVMGSEPFPFDNWISNDNKYINKPTQTRVLTNINMDNTIPGSMNARSRKIPTIGTKKIIAGASYKFNSNLS
jgi:hypothetical protein